MAKISVVISAFNEEIKIEDCLKSASFADEIIFVDGSSTDNTVKIAKKYTSKIFVRENNPMLNVNKNFGFLKALNEWVLSLDADERVTPELAKEIESSIANHKSSIVGYWIPRKNIIFGKWIQHSGWYPDHQLRVFRKGRGKFEEKHVHEMVKVDGKLGYLTSPILHYNYENVSQFLRKLETYTQNEADQLFESGYTFDFRDAMRFPTKEFLSRFFARKGYKDGLAGLVLSIFMAFYHFTIFVRMWELRKFKDIPDKDFLRTTEKEILSTGKEIKFWIKKEKRDLEKNPIKKILYKISS